MNCSDCSQTRIATPEDRWFELLLCALACAGSLLLGGCATTAVPVAAQPHQNSLGMKFVPVPGTDVRCSIWETRLGDFATFADATGYRTDGKIWTWQDGQFAAYAGYSWRHPGFAQTTNDPVCAVSWADAQAFCHWLTEKERAAGRLGSSQCYRLPTDAEWSLVVGLTNETGTTPADKNSKIQQVYPWGTEFPPPHGAGNFLDDERIDGLLWPKVIPGYRDGYHWTSPVGSYAPNRYGIYDLSGNVWEWCADEYPGLGGAHVLRGGSFANYDDERLLSSYRRPAGEDRNVSNGFRVVLGSSLTAAKATTEQWGIYEIELNGPTNGNPFLDVQLSAVFDNGSKRVEVPGFYDGDGVYKIRFMPDTQGRWQYKTKANRPELTSKTGEFTATPPGKDNHGPVRVAHTFHFDYADGTPYRELGTTCYYWANQSEELENQTLSTLATTPFNKVRMCVFPNGKGVRLFPYVGTPPHKWDFTTFNPEFFRHFEQRIQQLGDLGIEADLILFHPYDKVWGFSKMDAASDDRYVRYVVARFGAYRNVWWSLANEYDFIKTKTEADWGRIGTLVQQSDPYHHLRSIHHSQIIYNNTLPWVTHASIQNGAAVQDPERAGLYRDVYRKPIVYDEVRYEGNSARRWGQLTGEELVLCFWNATVAGTYVSHGEVIKNWSANGGDLHGQSVPRLAFLKKILADSPPEGIEPIDKWYERRMGGQPGDYYLMYFGAEMPTNWLFHLYKRGVAAGMRFKVEVIDTWNMTITPVPGEFVTKKKGDYDFVDAEGRAVPLPGKPYIALRMINVGSATNRPDPNAFIDPN